LQTNTDTQKKPLTVLAKAILKALLYFDVFQFPLNKKELEIYMNAPFEHADKELPNLLEAGLIAHDDVYYGFEPIRPKVRKRMKAELEAWYIHPMAVRVTWVLKLIPFIRCICVSGSLSKGVMEEDSDIDFFIIVQKNRLWMVRAIFSFLIFSLSIFNIKKYFCPNYIMVDSDMEVKDKNMYTAVEIRSLMPMYNYALYWEFLEKNEWIKEYVPNPYKKGAWYVKERKHILRRLWYSKYINFVDDIFFALYRWHYGRKFRNLKSWNLTPRDVRFQKNVYKMHNTGHRSRILDQYEKRVAEFEKEYNIDLSEIR